MRLRNFAGHYFSTIMLKKYIVLIGVLLSLLLLLISTTQYPGGSQADAGSTGFSWRHNYLSNLLNPIAVNGLANDAQPWAVAGVVFLCISATAFFIRFSRKIPVKSASHVVRYAGVGATAFGLGAATPFHDSAVALSGALLMLSLFYVTVFVFKSKLHGFKVLSVVFLLVLYGSSFVYYTRTGLEYLPLLQKSYLVIAVCWILGLEYFTGREDFEGSKAG